MRAKTSDILDRWTILRMKARYDKSGCAEQELKDYQLEIETLMRDHGTLFRSFDFVSALLDLQESNAKVWENEAAIRKEFSGDPANSKIDDEDLAEIGRRTLIIRGYNKIRVQAKTELDRMFGDTPDVKVDHASE